MQPRILAVSGSSRAGSLNLRLLDAACTVARAQGATVTRLDLRALALPLYDGDLEAAQGLPAGALTLKRELATHHGLLLASPEYNGLITPLLKNAIDWASRPQPGQAQPFAGRVATLLAASPGALGGLRGLPVVRQLLCNLGMLVTPGQMALPLAAQAFADDGGLREENPRQMLERTVGELLATARALRPPLAEAPPAD